MLACDREGQFRATITEYGLKESKDGAVGISLRAHLKEIADGLDDVNNVRWSPWAEYGMEAEGDLWVIKKDGEINSLAAESLIRNAGWDGSLESISGQTWQPTPCQVAVKKDVYNGQTRFKIAFVNDFNRNPLAVGNVDSAKAKELQGRFGAKLRAVAGNARRNGQAAQQPIGSAPPAPPPPVAARLPGMTEEQIPF